LDFLRSLELSTPSWKGAGLGFAAVPLEFHQTQEQIAQSGHYVSAAPAADAGVVFAQAHIAPVMRAVFNGPPVIADRLEQLLSVVLLGGRTGAVKSVFFGGRDNFGPAQLLALSPHGQELPATAQTGIFGTDSDPLNAPANQAAMFLAPAGVVFRGKKNLWAAVVAPAPVCRFDCL
jgi:hypothetical protein